MNSKRILLVEDDESLGFVIQDNLIMGGYDVDWCKDGERGAEAFKANTYALCLLDVMLPKKDGFTLADEIRQVNDQTPIIFLTARSMQEDRIKGFLKGGDDYITKPFSIEELLLRINVFIKRSVATATATHYQLGKFRFECDNLMLINGTNEKKLTQKEADVLKLFCQHQNQVLKRELILKAIWGEDDYFLGRSLDVFISKLRKYLKEDPSIEITNYHGVGFQFSIKQ